MPSLRDPPVHRLTKGSKSARKRDHDSGRARGAQTGGTRKRPSSPRPLSRHGDDQVSGERESAFHSFVSPETIADPWSVRGR